MKNAGTEKVVVQTPAPGFGTSRSTASPGRSQRSTPARADAIQSAAITAPASEA